MRKEAKTHTPALPEGQEGGFPPHSQVSTEQGPVRRDAPLSLDLSEPTRGGPVASPLSGEMKMNGGHEGCWVFRTGTLELCALGPKAQPL